jgi:hypothetical protein
VADPSKHKLAITPATLEQARIRKAEARARIERSFYAAANLPPPAPVLLRDSDRTLRTMALGLAAFASFAPAALLADHVLVTATLFRNLVVLALLTLLPAVASARAERAPEAEDLPRARFMHRFSPLALAVLVVLSGIFPFTVHWEAVETALLLQAPLALFLHVPRVRWVHLLVTGWGALASLALDDRALVGAAPMIALVALAASLDRGLHVRLARTGRSRPELRVPLAATALAGGGFALVLAASLALLPHMVRTLPVATTVRATRSLSNEKAHTPILELLLAVVAMVLVLALYHFLAERSRRAREGEVVPSEGAPLRPVLEPLDELAGAEDARWPRGPRRTIVRRYLEHLVRLARSGVARRPAEGALDMAALVARRFPAAGDAEERLARAFILARYSPEPVSEALAASAEEAAKAAEMKIS